MVFKPNSLEARDVETLLHPYTNLVAHRETGPLVITGGKGVRVVDNDGKSYIEGLAGLWCTSLGFDEPRLVEAATAALKQLPYYHGFAGKSAPPMIELAERLLEKAPVPMSKVFFANSGSEANDSVIKMIWYYNNAKGRPEKKKILSRMRGYHGVTVASASLTGLPANQMSFDLPIANILHVDCPHHYRGAEPGESEEDFASRLAENLDRRIQEEGPDTVAAMFAEPIMGAGGVIVPPATYFEKIQAVLKKYDVLLVADEVICGFGRTGNYWGSQTYGLKPDILSCAKALSSAYLPISAVMINEEVYQTIADHSAQIGTFGHGFTYSGHPVPASVAIETMKIYDERDIIGQVRQTGPGFQQALRQFQDHPLVGEVRGTALIAAIEVVEDKASRKAFDPKRTIGAHLAKSCQDRGVILRGLGDSLAICPPLIIEQDDLDTIVSVIGEALDETKGRIDRGEI